MLTAVENFTCTDFKDACGPHFEQNFRFVQYMTPTTWFFDENKM